MADVPDLSSLVRTVTSTVGVEALARPLLDVLGHVTGLESTYLTAIHWDDVQQEIVVARNVGRLDIPEGLLVDWSDTLCRRALRDGPTATDDVPTVWPDSQAAAELGITTYASVPVVLPDMGVYGTLCGASAARQDVASDVLAVFELFAELLAARIAHEIEFDRERERAVAIEERYRARVAEFASLEHQMKTPLTVLTGWSELIAQRDRLKDSDWAAAVDGVSRQVKALRTLVDDLLATARLDYMATSVQPRAVDLVALLRVVVDEWVVATPERRITAQLPNRLFALADPVAVEQIVAHLVENAIKYSEAGTAIEVSAVRDREWVRLDVRDEGVGVPVDTSGLFEPFQRATSTSTSASAGIGLHVVRTLVQAQGGEVSAARQEGPGSVFTVRLPGV